MKVIRLSGGALVAALLVISPLAAAGGGVSGRVVDRSGDPVPGATVRIECVEGGTPFQLVTDERGRFPAQLPEECHAGYREQTGSLDGLLVGLQPTHSCRFCKPNDHARWAPRIAYHHPLPDEKFQIDPTNDDCVQPTTS